MWERPLLACHPLLGILWTYDWNYFWGNVVLGNVVISKNFLRTRKIMVMHSNKRGEYCLRTLVDRKRKRYINAVDVVVRLHDPTDPSTVTPTPPISWHTFSSMTIPGLRSSKASGRSSVSTTAW